ncbi:MAG: hypothetical protein WCQ54_06130 [Clostridiaceae bacterium]
MLKLNMMIPLYLFLQNFLSFSGILLLLIVDFDVFSIAAHYLSL